DDHESWSDEEDNLSRHSLSKLPHPTNGRRFAPRHQIYVINAH
ncbi:hypothetical protein AVEN_24233-1, partial [Araneus ventricosus]